MNIVQKIENKKMRDMDKCERLNVNTMKVNVEKSCIYD